MDGVPVSDLWVSERPAAAGEEGRGLPAPLAVDVVVSYRSAVARAGHVLLVASGWVAFALLWARVLGRPGAWASVQVTLLRVAGLAAFVTVATAVWVAHNVALARRRGGRRGRTPSLALPDRDLLGRTLRVDPLVADAAMVVVGLDGRGKTFSPGTHDG